MRSNWITCSFGEVVDFNPKESLPKGTMAKKIGMDKLQPFCRDIPGYEIEAFSGGTKFRNDDTIMARITPCLENGKTAKVSILDENEIGFGSTEYIVFRAKEGVTDPDFVYYLVCSSAVREPAIKSMVGSSGRQRVQTDVVERLEIEIPPLEEQKKIASVLKSIDDKIAQNNEINKNLLEQDIAIVRDLAAKATTASPLREICDEISAGGTPNRKRSEFWDSPDLIWVKNGEVKNNILLDTEEHISIAGMNGSSAKLIPANSILFAMYCVSTPQLAINVSECTTNQAVCALMISDFDLMCYVYAYMMYFGTKLTNLANGAAQQNLNKGLISDFVIDLPAINLIKESPLASHIRKRIQITIENNTLTQLRDALLHRLLAGEIDVSDIDF